MIDDIYRVYSLELALHLINDKYFKLLNALPNKLDDTKVVFYFKETDELLKAVSDYTAKYKERLKKEEINNVKCNCNKD